MKMNQFMQFPRMADLVRKYQGAGNFVWTGRHIRTIGAEKLPRETKTAFNLANRTEEFIGRRTLKGLKL